VSEFERPDRIRREPTVEDVRQLMGASTPHFALQIRNRIRTLVAGLAADHPARIEGEREIARLELLALERMRAAGLQNVDGRVGDPDPIVAVMDVWDPMKFDDIVVSTLPTGSSRWLGLDLPHRLEKLTSVPVLHVVSRPRVAARTEPAPEHEHYGVLSPLAAAFRPR
jgi:hypothetical protein